MPDAIPNPLEFIGLDEIAEELVRRGQDCLIITASARGDSTSLSMTYRGATLAAIGMAHFARNALTMTLLSKPPEPPIGGDPP